MSDTDTVSRGKCELKKYIVVILALIMLMMLGGCNYVEELVINSDGTYTAMVSQYMNIDDINMASRYTTSSGKEPVVYTEESFEEAYASSGAAEGELKTKVIDGVKYYLDSTNDATESVSKSTAYQITADSFVLKANEDNNMDDLLERFGKGELEQSGEDMEKLKSMVTVSLNVTMPSEIVFTNGTLSADKKTVTFKYSLKKYKNNYYAYTKNSPELIRITGLDGKYTRKKTIRISTFDKVKGIKLNGEEISTKKLTLDRDGVYTLTVKTEHGRKTVKFTRDTAAPVVSGVESGKNYKEKRTISFSDDGSGIKSATLNGKKIRNGASVKKTGRYKLVVEDRAGNKTKVSFKITK